MRAFDIIEAAAIDLGYDEANSTVTALLLRHLNRAISEIANTSRCIQRTKYQAATASQHQYGLPSDFLRIRSVRWQNYPPLIFASIDSIYRARYVQSTGIPAWYSLDSHARDERCTGTATGGSNTSLIDTGVADFAAIDNPVKPGDLALNETDDSEATVTVVAGNTLTLDGLVGGSDNLFALGDDYRILSPQASVKVVVLHPAPSATDTTGVESIAVLYDAKHRVITQTHIDDSNDELEIDDELETALIHRIAYWTHGAGSPERQMAQVEYNTSLVQAIPSVRKRVNAFVSRWESADYARSITASGTSRSAYPWNSVVI